MTAPFPTGTDTDPSPWLVLKVEMAVPILKPTNVQDETFAGVTYHVQGELVPVLVTEIGGMPVYFEHHILLWKDPMSTSASSP